MKRDLTLDMLRGGIMLYIILVIHGICNFAYLNLYSIEFSVLMFEMPVIFYLAGASLKLSTEKPLFKFVKSRIYRILIPYLIWAIIVIIPILIFGNITNDIKRLILVQNIYSIPYVNQIWFILPYVTISIAGWFLIKFYKKRGGVFILLYISVVLLVVGCVDMFETQLSMHPTVYLVGKEILVFSVFYVAGFNYGDNLKRKKGFGMLFLFCLIFIFLIYTDFYPFATQKNKLPPNLAYLCFGMIFVTILGFFGSGIKLKENTFLKFANKYGMELYLYQNYAFWMFAALVLPYIEFLPKAIQYLIECVVIILILFPIVPHLNRFNNLIINRIKLMLDTTSSVKM